MTQSTTERSETGTQRPAARTSSSALSTRNDGSHLQTELGNTTIADNVVAKIAGIAAREVSGVHALGGGVARTVGALRERIPGGRTNTTQGIRVEVGERQAAVDVTLVAEYGIAIAELAAGIRRNIIEAIERMTGLEVTEVNVDVQDVHIFDEDDEEPADTAPARVQ